MSAKERFVNEWKHEIAGIALFGFVCDVKEKKANTFHIPALSVTLLGDMFDGLVESLAWEDLVEKLSKIHNESDAALKEKIVGRLRETLKKEGAK